MHLESKNCLSYKQKFIKMKPKEIRSTITCLNFLVISSYLKLI